MRLIIDHQTRYHYADVVRRSTQYLRLTPHSTARQQILSWELELRGRPPAPRTVTATYCTC